MADELTDEEKRQGLVSPTQLAVNKFVEYMQSDAARDVEEFLRDMPFRLPSALFLGPHKRWEQEVGEAMPAEIIGSADAERASDYMRDAGNVHASFSPPFEGGHAYGITRPPTIPIDLDSDDGEYFSERIGGPPQDVSDTYRQQAGDRVTRAARELGAGSGIFTAPKGSLEQIRKWEETAINELMVQAKTSR